MSVPPHRRLAAAFACAICFAATAHAAAGPRAIVRTVTTSALGEVHGVHLHTIDLDSGASIGVPLWLPGDAPVSALQLNREGRIAASTVHTGRLGLTQDQQIAVFGVLPLPPQPASWFEDMGAGAETSAGFVHTDDQRMLASYLTTTLPGTETERGTIVLRPVGRSGAITGPGTRQLLPGMPVAGLTFNREESVAVLAWERDSAQWSVHAMHAATQTGLHTAPVLAAGSDGPDQNAALGVTGDEQFLLALIPDSIADFSDRGSTLIAVNSESLEMVGERIRIRGAPDRNYGVITPGNGSAAWIATRNPTSAFGFVTYIELDQNGPTIKDDPSYSTCDAAPVVAANPETGRAAIAVGNRLETRTAGEGVTERREFNAAIGAVAWSDSAILLGEGGRFHRLDADDLSVATTVQLQTGRIDAIVTIPPSALELDGDAQSQNADSDDDGVLDGVDPDVGAPNAVLRVNPRMYLRARAAGYERRLLRIDSVPRIDGQWSIHVDEAAAPWLHVGGNNGAIPGGPQLRLDPGLLPRSSDAVVTIDVHAVDADNRVYAGSPAQVRVTVLDNAAPVRRIAWIFGDAANRERVQSLADTLSGAPLHFTHEYADSGAMIDAQRVGVVVMDEAAADQSLVTRRAITEFVRTGGSLVFVRAAAPDTLARSTAEWLRPFGVMLSNGDALQQGAAVLPTHPLARLWQPSWKTVAGRAFSVESSAATVLAANDREPDAAFASTGHYGLGRTAVFASPSILFDAGPTHRRLAVALFSWLSRASFSDDPGQRDSDGDTLPDWLEDRNRDGVHDPGETDWMNPDTDGDGIPDGSEDINLNGAFDAGETSPLSLDTDGDGIWDGADATPIPPFAAPLIATVFPNTAPAQGGRTIVIQGRNLRESQRVWFGDRLARDVRTADANAMSVVVPPASPQSQSPVVDIRIEDTTTGLDHVAAGAFTYSEPARVQLTLSPVPEASGPNIGVVSLRLASREKVAIGRIAFTLTTTPPDTLTWGGLEPGVAATTQGRSVTGSITPDGSYAIAVGASREAQGMGEFVTIPWAFAGDPGVPVTVQIENARVTADNGYPLHVDAPASFNLR